MNLFTDLMASIRHETDELLVDIPEDWMQGRTTYGGLSAALCLEAVFRSSADMPPLRSADIAFVGPTGGPVRLKAETLRAGKSVTFAGADLIGDKGLATRSTFAFGAARASAFDFDDMAAPDLPAPEESENFFTTGAGPSFTAHYDVKLARGARPVSGSSVYDHYLWVRHKDERATSVSALLALADMPPPAVLPMFRELAPISSMTWHLNFLVDAPTTQDGWWLLQSCAEHAREGYSSQNMRVWNSDGAPVIAGRQSVAIFA